jgi:aspartate carbamoyltransferase regulatory subunit
MQEELNEALECPGLNENCIGNEWNRLSKKFGFSGVGI